MFAFCCYCFADEKAQQKHVRQDLENHVPAFAFKLLPFSWSNALDLLTSRVSRLHSSAPGKGRRALVAKEQSIAQLFEFFDKNDSDFVDEEEFSRSCRQLFRDSLDDHDIETCFRLLDPLGRGEVDFKTWEHFFTNFQKSYEENDRLNLRHLLSTHLATVERVVCQTFEHWCVGRRCCCRLRRSPRTLRLNSGLMSRHAPLRYSNATLLRLIVERMHGVVIPSMAAAISNGAVQAAKDGAHQPEIAPIVIHVGHDVTIVPLLYALGAWTADRGW